MKFIRLLVGLRVHAVHHKSILGAWNAPYEPATDNTHSVGYTLRTKKNSSPNHQVGFSYVEVMVATFILAIALVPALQSLQSGIQGVAIHESIATDHYQLVGKMEEVLAEPFANLLIAAATAANKTTLTGYSDTAGNPQRRLVFLSFYDAANSDGDADPFTIADANTDGDSNPYTGTDVDINLLWVRVEIENTIQSLETLTSR